IKLTFVVDFIGLDGFPTCRLTDIVDFCDAHSCSPIVTPAPTRICKELTGTLATGEMPADGVNDVLRQLAGTVVTDDAPSDAVILRVVATTQPCSELGDAGGFNADDLVGCVFSCPLQLDLASGDILLDLPTLTDKCEDQVAGCAGG